MFVKVCPDTGFNDQAVAHWNYELVAPPDPPVTLSARGRAVPEHAPVEHGSAARRTAERAAARDDDDKDKAGPGGEGSARDVVTPQEEVPVPQPVPTLTLYFVGGGELKLEGTDAEKVHGYYSVPSSHLTVL